MVKLEIMNPVASTVVRRTPVAVRPPNLDNKKIGLYWNSKGGGDIILRRIGEQIQRRFVGVEVEMVLSSIPGPKQAVEAAKRFQAVVGSSGD